MIEPSMSNLAIYEALDSDRTKLRIRADFLLPRVKKQFAKDNKFPAIKWVEYTHQESHNQYLISFYAKTSADVICPVIDYIALIDDEDAKGAIHWGHWIFRRTGSLEGTATRYLGLYRSHFFKRYHERFLKNQSFSENDIICHYFSRNYCAVPLEMNEDINRNYKRYGTYADVAFQVYDGTCFIRQWHEGDINSIGTLKSDFISVVQYHTFVDNDTISHRQRQAIIKEISRYYSNDCNSLMQAFANNQMAKSE